MRAKGVKKRFGVLVVDDSDLIRDRLIAMLDDIDGADVVGEAADGRTAVELTRELDPDVVILDIGMPGNGGLNVLQEIMSRDPGLTVVILTNHTNALYRSRCIKLGASFFFDKAKEFDQLTKVMTDLVEERS